MTSDDESDTQIVQRHDDDDAVTNQPMGMVMPMVKPRAIHAVAAQNPSSYEVRPVGQGGHGGTLVGMRTPRAMTAVGEPVRTRPPTMQQVMATVSPINSRPGERISRVRATGTPSPVPLFGGSALREAVALAVAPAPQETILMPHAEHDSRMAGTVAMVQSPAAEQSVAVMHGTPYVAQVAAPVRGEVVGGEITAKPHSKFAEYAEIGLPNPQPSRAAKGAARLVVSGYRLLGFCILTCIVAVLIAYITTTAFYFVSHSWIVPTVISPTDDKVIQLRTALAEQQNIRGKIESDMHDAERAAAAEGDFQKEFANAIKADLDGRKVALNHMQSLAGAAYATRQKISATNEGYAAQVQQTSQKDLDAGLIDRNHAMSANFQVAQISDAQLRLQESEVVFEQQAADIKQQADALDALLDPTNPKRKALSYEVLKEKHDYDLSKVALAKALESRKTLLASLVRQDEIINGLKDSAYLRALDDKSVVAQVPYGNVENAKAGTPLYSCQVGMVMCHQVGEVGTVLPGEIQFKNPKRDTLIRGVMVELKMTDTDAATDEVLFVGGEPLGF